MPQREPYHPLGDSLNLAVPLKIQELHRAGGPTDADFSRAREFSWTLAEKGDILLYRSARKGETAVVFNQMVYAIAVASFFPGGIKILGVHYQTEIYGLPKAETEHYL